MTLAILKIYESNIKLFKILSQSYNAKGQNVILPIAVGQLMLENCSINLEESLSHREYVVWSMVL